jgi:hypothetical protein
MSQEEVSYVKHIEMSASFVTCSGCAKMYRTRNGFARHALTVHQSLGLGSGLLLPLSGDALVTRQDDLRARDRRRHVRKTPVEPLDLRVVTSNRVRPIAASSTLSSAADQSTPSSFSEGRTVRSLPCISDVIRRQMTAVFETVVLLLLFCDALSAEIVVVVAFVFSWFP